MSDTLPPLPKPAWHERKCYINEGAMTDDSMALVPLFTAEQVQAIQAEAYAAGLAAGRTAPAWQPIETAPRGSGEDGPADVRRPDYVAPPDLLLKHADGIAVGYYEWYYHPGYGRGASPDEPVWRSRPDYSGLHEVTHWMPLPAAPEAKR